MLVIAIYVGHVPWWALFLAAVIVVGSIGGVVWTVLRSRREQREIEAVLGQRYRPNRRDAYVAEPTSSADRETRRADELGRQRHQWS
jgi:hypothetical protein